MAAQPKDELQLEQYYHLTQSFPTKNANSYMEHLCDLDIYIQPHSVRATAIICTIGTFNEKNKQKLMG
jgi:hypothetical protein